MDRSEGREGRRAMGKRACGVVSVVMERVVVSDV
jgi:hypothetical protein